MIKTAVYCRVADAQVDVIAAVMAVWHASIRPSGTKLL